MNDDQERTDRDLDPNVPPARGREWEPPGGLARPRYIRGTYETNRLRRERRR